MALTATTYMLLVRPEVGVDVGPTWATLLNALLLLVDAHDHSTGKGTKVTQAGINITADLEMNSQDLTEIRTLRLEDQAGTYTANPDRGCIYRNGDNLYYTDGSGNAVQLTLAGAVNTAASGSIVGMGSTTAAVTYVNGTKVFSFTQNTGIPAKMATGDIRLAEAISAGKGPLLRALAGTAADYDFTFPGTLPASTKFLSITSAGQVAHTATIQSTDIGALQVDNAAIAAGAVTSLKCGAEIQVGYASLFDSSVGAVTATIPYDDTIPQNAEGSVVQTLAYTPKKVGNKLRIRSVLNVSPGAAATAIAYVRQSSGNAVGVGAKTIASGEIGQVIVEYEETVASLSAVQWEVALGSPTGATLTRNGVASARRFGGTLYSSLEIREIAQ